MKTVQIYLQPNNALLTGFCYEKDITLPESNARPAVLVFGGGAYRYISAKERDPIAMAYLHEGFNAFVLHYSVTEASEGSPIVKKEEVLDASLDDAKEALKYLREHATQLNIDPNRIAIVGFSAGGNLALRLSVFTDEKPNALILGYPAIDSNQLKEESVLNHIDQDMPPVFMFHTAYDSMVSPQNSLSLAMILSDLGIPFETHIFSTGDHGLALATKNTGTENEDVAKWHSLSVRFLTNIYSGKNLLWGDLVDEPLSIDTRNDILYANPKAKDIFDQYIPQFTHKMIENPFLSCIPFRRFASLVGIDTKTVHMIQSDLNTLKY